jgi:stringent starvation protein B
MAEISTKPYLIRALYEWCADNGYRPYIAVAVDERTLVPREFVRNGEIVLNISAAATNRLSIGNELLEFEARFGGVARQVSIPIENVSAIFAQENGHGMAFEVPKTPSQAQGEAHDAEAAGSVDAGSVDAGSDAAAPPAAADAPIEAGTGDTAPAPGRARRRPKLASVPASGEPARASTRRKGRIAAVPAAAADAASRQERSTDPGKDGNGGDGDEPGPGAPAPGRPHLTRVK